MHELSIIQNIFKVVEQTAKENHLSKITKVHLKIGKLRQIVPEFLQFAFEAVSKDTIAAGAELLLEFVPVTVSCQKCGENFEVTRDRDFSLVCPHCQSVDIKILTGKEIVLDNVEGEN